MFIKIRNAFRIIVKQYLRKELEINIIDENEVQKYFTAIFVKNASYLGSNLKIKTTKELY